GRSGPGSTRSGEPACRSIAVSGGPTCRRSPCRCSIAPAIAWPPWASPARRSASPATASGVSSRASARRRTRRRRDSATCLRTAAGGRPVSAEQLAGTIGAVIDERAVDSESRPFITCSGATIAYGDFAERVWRLTGALAELGVRPGDKLCLFLPNGLPFALTMFAAARLGMPFVPAHAQFTAREVRYVLQHADVVIVVVDAERLPFVQEIRD